MQEIVPRLIDFSVNPAWQGVFTTAAPIRLSTRGMVSVMANAEPDDHQVPQADAGAEEDVWEEHPYAPGVNGLLEAVANVIEKDRFVEALSGWVDSYAQKVKADGEKAKTEERYRWHAYWMSLIFSLGIFTGLAVLTWNGKISKETAGTLFGALIGYWFGRQQKKGD
jgi:hypothetical protein